MANVFTINNKVSCCGAGLQASPSLDSIMMYELTRARRGALCGYLSQLAPAGLI